VEDEKIVAWFLDTGDQAAFALLVERYQDKVFRLACSVLGPFSEVNAEDVCQEIFIKLYKKMRLFSGKSSFRTWLYRLAYNMALDWRRRNKVRISEMSAADREALISEGNVDDPLESLLNRENKLFVARALEKLPELYRTMVYLHYWLETPVEEMAEELNLPEGTVKSYLFRARQYLRKIMELELAGVQRMAGEGERR